MANERWVPIPDYEDHYEVSDQGRVRSLSRTVFPRGSATRITGQELKATPDNLGYPAVSLWRDGKQKTFRVHQLVARAFVPGERPGMQVCHGDGTRTNNHYTNLRWGTPKENAQDKYVHGTAPKKCTTHCQNGHPLAADNIIIESSGKRRCKTCRRVTVRLYKRRVSVAWNKREARDAQIMLLLAEGLPQHKVAKLVGLTQAGVSVAVKRIKRARLEAENG